MYANQINRLTVPQHQKTVQADNKNRKNCAFLLKSSNCTWAYI